MGEIVLWTRENDFPVAGDLDLARPIAPIGDRKPADLHVVFRRHDDLELRFEIAVAPPERDFLELECRLVFIGFATDRLVGRGPHLAGPWISEVDEMRAR